MHLFQSMLRMQLLFTLERRTWIAILCIAYVQITIGRQSPSSRLTSSRQESQGIDHISTPVKNTACA